jgi:hypothetical protein
MKKKLLLLTLFVLVGSTLFGCSMNNTPKKTVETLLMNYKNNGDNIVTELDDYLNGLAIDNDYYEDYKQVYLRQYQDLDYEIKDETIDGDNATVTVQIEVYDYYKVENDVNNYIATNPDEFNENGVYSTVKGLQYRIEQLNKSSDRVTYTIEFNLTKVDNNWTIDNLTDEDLEKIHGTYAH